VPFAQSFHSAAFLHVRLQPGDEAAAAGLMESIRRQVRETDPRLPVLSLRTFRAHLQASGEQWIVRTGAWLFTLFGALALFLALIGVYAVKAYAVSQRTREIGIRMALGARRSDVVGMIVREGLRLTGVAMLLGIPLAAGLGQLLRGALYQVGALDPVVFTLTPVLLTAAALVAAYLPARRAARIEPMRALRYE
jgi:ABC-type antimicrobial peptide transport system permease subunit